MRIKKYFHLSLVILVLIGSKLYAGDVRTSENNSMIRFTENKRQWEERILYKAQLDGGSMFLEKNCFTYNFYDKDALIEDHANSRASPKTISSHAFRMTFLNALSIATVEASNTTSDYCNYFIGNDESKWAGNVRNYKNLKYVNLYDHINLEIEGFQNSLKYNFIVAPLGNTDHIQMSYEGLDAIFIQKGALHLKTRINELTEHSPFAYQWMGSRRVEVPCEFVLENNTVHFNFPQGYNKGYELIIDPEVVFSASSGSLADNFGHTCTYDAEGNLYSGGIAFGSGYPTKMAYDPTFNSGWIDVVITKYNALGTDLVYSTYLGGNSDEIVTSMIVDAENNLVLYGVTGSGDFPVTANAYSTKNKLGSYYFPHLNNGNKFQRGTDIYVCKLSAGGNALVASTFIGGSKNDGVNYNDINICYRINGLFVEEVNCANYSSSDSSKLYCYTHKLDSLQFNYGDYYRGEIDLDKFGNVYVATSTRSPDFPIINGFGKTLKGKQDGVVFKMNSDLSKLEWSTFLGGSNKDAAYALILDDSANVYVTGGTASNDFPTTPGVVQKNASNGKSDGFIAKIKYDGTEMKACSYWGTDKYDQSFFVQLDKKNDVYLFGQTDGKMVVEGDNVYKNSNSGQFITKMNNQLTDVLFSTVIGNGDSITPTICPTAFLVDVCGNIYVAGWASRYNKYKTVNIPTTKMPVTKTVGLDSTTAGFDFYLMVLKANADSLLYGTYWGGNKSKEHVHGGTSRFDKKGIVYQSLCTGCGSYDDYPVTPGAWPHADDDSTLINGSNCNNAVFKIDFKVNITQANFTVNNTKGCAPLTVQFKNQSTSGKILWDFGNGDTTTVNLNPVYTFDDPGTYVVKLFVNNPASCNQWDSVYQYITVYEPITTDFDFDAAPCSNEITFKDLSVQTPTSWEWDFGDGTKSTSQDPKHTYTQFNKTYSVKLISKTVNGCADTTTMNVDFAGSTTKINGNKTVCKGAPVQLAATGGFEYRWTPSTGLSDSTTPTPIASPDTTTIYKVFIKTKNALGDTCESALSTKVIIIDPSKISLIAIADRDSLLKGETTTLHAITDTTLTVYWNPTTGVKDPTAFHTQVTPQVTTTYTVSITDSLGCSKSALVTIYVLPNECEETAVFIPNTFTPNGDGQNDILYARSTNITTIYFAVYNRWGELMFETTDLKKGWDGNYKGMKADPAVFAWYVRGKCYNGQEFFRKGNVTLIR